MIVDTCGFCGGELLAESAEAGWVFVCRSCGRETVLSDAFMRLVVAMSDPEAAQ